MILTLVVGLCAACGKEEAEDNELAVQNESSQVEVQSSSADEIIIEFEWDYSLQIDFTFDYS